MVPRFKQKLMIICGLPPGWSPGEPGGEGLAASLFANQADGCVKILSFSHQERRDRITFNTPILTACRVAHSMQPHHTNFSYVADT